MASQVMRITLKEMCIRDRYDKTAKYTINKGIDCLTENGALHWLTQLLELKKECEERLGEKAEAEERCV